MWAPVRFVMPVELPISSDAVIVVAAPAALVRVGRRSGDTSEPSLPGLRQNSPLAQIRVADYRFTLGREPEFSFLLCPLFAGRLTASK
jgi:hypothetical protein